MDLENLVLQIQKKTGHAKQDVTILILFGKYGMPVQALLKKAKTLDIQMICPLHGPILKENLGYYLEKYEIWSSYQPEEEGIFIAFASIHGNTKDAAKYLEKVLTEKGTKKVVVTDLARCDMAEAVEDAFRYDTLVLASSSYNAELFPPMEHFLRLLKGKNFQNRKVAIIENGLWAPSAARCMKEILSQMKEITFCKTEVNMRGKLKEENKKELEKLAEEIAK